MNHDKMRLEQIEHFLQDELNDAERTEMEKLLHEDDEFRKAFEEYQLLVEGIKYAGRNSLMDTFKSIEERNYRNKPAQKPVRSLRKYYIGLAASIALLLISYMGVERFYFKTPEKVAASFFEPYPVLVGGTTRSADEERSSLELAMQLFETEKFVDAIKILERLDTENQELVNFYLANAYQATGAYNRSITVYRQIIDENGVFKEQAEWYLALAYLSTEQLDLAKDQLVSIKNSGGDYAEKANKVLNSID